MGKLSRTKGAVFERFVANSLLGIYPLAKRGCAQLRNNSDKEDHKADIEGTPFWIECCHSKTANIWNKLEQAQESGDGRIPIVVARRDRTADIVAMDIRDFKMVALDLEVLRVLRLDHPEIVKTAEAKKLRVEKKP